MATKRNHPDELVIGLVSISDRASQGVYEDKGIPSLQEWLASALSSPWRAETRLIHDDAATISATLIELVDETGCDLILTTGGTGPSRRDVTPEATLAVATKPMPGFGEQMRQISLNFVPTAILSRQVAVIRETPDHAALIVNLPGQPKSIRETLEGLRDADGKSKVTTGRYLTIWRKEPDGSWKVLLDASQDEPAGSGECCKVPATEVK